MKKTNIPMRLAAVVFALFLITTSLASNLYARYTGSDDGGSEARVAKFEVTDQILKSGKSTSINIGRFMPTSAENSEYQLEVSNRSEVAVRVTVQLVNATGNLPLVLAVDGTTETTVEIAPNDTAKKTFQLEVAWSTEASATDFTYAGKVDEVDVVVLFEQID